MIEVRPFESDDLPQVWALAHLPDSGITEDAGAPLPLVARRVPPTGPADLVDPTATVVGLGGDVFVAVDDGHVVGVGGLRPVHDRPRLGRVVRIRVHPAVRRRGVGSALMEAVQTSARRRGLTDLLLDVGDHQPEALAFYRALGWSETWREAGPEWHWQTVWFHRSLERDHLAVEVRPCAGEDDVVAAERSMPTGRNEFHHVRWEQQRDAGATYLLAWDGQDVVGHVLLLPTTRFPEVSQALGASPEVRALGVAEGVRRRGVGTALMGAAAGVVQQQGAHRLGLAVERTDEAASTLCRRLGWTRQPGVDVIDEWTWIDERGTAHEEREACGYWVLDLPRAAGQGG